MNNTENYRIGGFLVCISDSLFGQYDEYQKHLVPFRITNKEELSKCTSVDADIRILDCRNFEGSLFDLEEGTVFYEEVECATPTKFYLMPDGSYGCELSNPDMDTIMIFHISSDWSVIEVMYEAAEDNGLLLFTRLGELFSVGVLHHNACVFHGVVMDYQRKGILVLAESGVGKSTHTNRWESLGLASIVNGDRCLCRKIDDKWYAYGMPWAGSSGKHLQKKVPISWIIDLKRGTVNRVEDMSAFEKEIFLLQRIFAPVTRGNQQEKAFAFAHELAQHAIVKRLYCLPDEESVLILKAQVDQASVMK